VRAAKANQNQSYKVFATALCGLIGSSSILGHLQPRRSWPGPCERALSACIILTLSFLPIAQQQTNFYHSSPPHAANKERCSLSRLSRLPPRLLSGFSSCDCHHVHPSRSCRAPPHSLPSFVASTTIFALLVQFLPSCHSPWASVLYYTETMFVPSSNSAACPSWPITMRVPFRYPANVGAKLYRSGPYDPGCIYYCSLTDRHDQGFGCRCPWQQLPAMYQQIPAANSATTAISAAPTNAAANTSNAADTSTSPVNGSGTGQSEGPAIVVQQASSSSSTNTGDSDVLPHPPPKPPTRRRASGKVLKSRTPAKQRARRQPGRS
jgi:hypothetical protein